MLYCELLDVPGVLRPEHQHYARELKLISERSGALIRRLLEGLNENRVRTPASKLKSRKLSVAAVVRSFTPVLRSLAAPETALSVHVAPGLPSLPFAGEVLERILVNLTRNAATALGAHYRGGDADRKSPGHIDIALRGGEGILTLVITDNGPGMPEDVVAAFLQPGPVPAGMLGSIGHKVVRDLVASTGGRLEITAEPGTGTTLRIDWPTFDARASSMEGVATW